jgi:tRNA(Ile)-lysidine synthase
MRENNIPILVTAHHSEDNIESILINIVRGCGIGGLKGIVPHRTFATDFHLVRPILKAQKQDVLDYCKENNLQFVYDSTNGDKTYLRNAIRSDITPQLQNIQPNLAEMFLRLSKSASEADAFIDAVASEFIEKECSNGAIPLDKLLSLNVAPLSRVISRFFEQSCETSLERVHVEAIIELCKKSVPHSSISLPSNKSAKIENKCLILEDDSKNDEDMPFSLPFFEGEYTLENGIIIRVL